MESVEFFAELLYKSKRLGGPMELDKNTIEKLYEIRRKMGLPGKHPADLCQNKGKKNCHNCGNGCGSVSSPAPASNEVSEEMVAEIVKKVMEQMK